MTLGGSTIRRLAARVFLPAVHHSLAEATVPVAVAPAEHTVLTGG